MVRLAALDTPYRFGQHRRIDVAASQPTRHTVERTYGMVQQLQVRQLAAMLEAGDPVFLLDVRQPWEHETAALPGSVLAPLDQLAHQARELTPHEGATIVVYCHHGIRSQHGAALLQHLGFQNVVSLAGGIDAWSLQVDSAVPRY